MRTIERTTVFRRDFNREKRSGRIPNLESLLADVVSSLAADKTLPDKNHDHALGGEWLDYRECHLKPDLLLIYCKPDPAVLQLVRMGSHSELFD